MSSAFKGEAIWIIGASSGIGRALAIELAGQGAQLILSARRQSELDALKRDLGDQHMVYTLDVSNTEDVLQTTEAIRSVLPRIDRVIFLAAAYTPMSLRALDIAATRKMVDVNVMGAFNMVHAILPILCAQDKGQLALCASVAGYTGLPDGQPYSATKAAVINLAESLRSECPASLDIKLICPGFVSTPLTEKNDFAMPMIISPEAAAKAIAKGLTHSSFEIHFPKRFTWFMKLLSCLPYFLYFKVAKTFIKKK